MTGPLSGIRIIEFAGLGPGPFCGMMLADHGAEVIRIDRIGAGGLVSDPDRDFLNRGRKGISLNLKDPRGVDLVRKLCASADAIIEGYRPGVMERLGLGPDVLLSDKPGLVYGRMTGWGQDGPYADMAGHDINYIALSGALHAIGRKDEAPVPPLNLLGDFGGGGMMLAFGLLAGVLSARTTGKGQVIDCAMTEGSAVLMSMIYSLRAQGRWQDERGVNLLDSGAHFYDVYETAEGKYIALGPVEPQFYRDMIERMELGDDPEFAVQNDPARWPAQKARLRDHIKTKTRAEWTMILEGTDACFAPVLSMEEAPMHPHNAARGSFLMVDGVQQPAPAPRFSDTFSPVPQPMRRGEDVSDALLASLGLTEAECRVLRADGVAA